MKLNKIVDQLLCTNCYLSVLYVSDNQINLDKEQIRYPNFFQISFQTMKKFISNPISSDLLVIELSEETILKLSIEEILEQIKFYEGVLVKTDTAYQFNYSITYENSLSFRKKILDCISKNYMIKNLLPTSNDHPLNFLCFASSLKNFLKPSPLKVQKSMTDYSALKNKTFHTAPGFKAVDLSSELNECKPFIKTKKHAIDVGARHGCFTRELINFGFEKVSAFELIPHFRSAFLKNVDNKYVDFYNFGLYDKSTLIHFEGRAGKGIKKINANEGSRVYALDDFEFDDISLLKIDVDGCERQILRGAKKLITRCLPVIHIETEDIQLKHDPEGLSRLEDIYQWLLDDLGYSIGHQSRNTVLYK